MNAEIQSIFDELVSVAHGTQAGLKPESLHALNAWAETDGYDELIDSWKDELLVLDLVGFSTLSFSDSELIDYNDCEEDEIDNALRLEYARERIATEFASGSDEYIFSLHQFPIMSGVGQTAILGGTGVGLGQGGYVWQYQGAFLSEAKLMEFLHLSGFVLEAEAAEILDETLLNLWQGPR